MTGPDERKAIAEDLRHLIEDQIANGFSSLDQAADAALEDINGRWLPYPDKTEWRPVADRLARECLREHFQAQAGWPTITDCDRLDEAFAELVHKGICCRQHLSYAGGALFEIMEEIHRAIEAGRAVRGFAYYPQDSTAE